MVQRQEVTRQYGVDSRNEERRMSLVRRGDVWSYEFWFAGQRIRESTPKTRAREAEKNRKRELDLMFDNEYLNERKMVHLLRRFSVCLTFVTVVGTVAGCTCLAFAEFRCAGRRWQRQCANRHHWTNLNRYRRRGSQVAY